MVAPVTGWMIVRARVSRYWVWSNDDSLGSWNLLLKRGLVFDEQWKAENVLAAIAPKYPRNVQIWVLTVEEAQRKWIEQEVAHE